MRRISKKKNSKMNHEEWRNFVSKIVVGIFWGLVVLIPILRCLLLDKKYR